VPNGYSFEEATYKQALAFSLPKFVRSNTLFAENGVGLAKTFP
jgi:hypothetical protein